MYSEQLQREAQQEQMGHSAGVDLAKHREQLQHQRDLDQERRANQAEQKSKAEK
jgi:hypothetical protein